MKKRVLKKIKEQEKIRRLKGKVGIENLQEPAIEIELKRLDRLAKRVILTTTKAIRGIDKTLLLITASERRLDLLTCSIKKKPTRRRV